KACGTRLMFAPHERQKLAPSRFCVAHLGQNIICPLSFAGVVLRTKALRPRPKHSTIPICRQQEYGPACRSVLEPTGADHVLRCRERSRPAVSNPNQHTTALLR